MIVATHVDYEHPTPDRAVCAGCGREIRRAVPLAELAVPVTALRPGDLVRFDGDPHADPHHDCADPGHDHWWTHEYGVIGRGGPDGPSGAPDGPDHYLLYHHHTERRDDPGVVRFPATHRLPRVGRVQARLWADQPETWHEPDSLAVCPTPAGLTPAHLAVAPTDDAGRPDPAVAVALYREAMARFRDTYQHFQGTAAEHEAAIRIPEVAGQVVLDRLRAAGMTELADELRTEHERLGLLYDCEQNGDRPADIWRERAHDTTVRVCELAGLPHPGPGPEPDPEGEARAAEALAASLPPPPATPDTPRPGDTVTYRAFNQHRMTTVIGPDGEPVQWSARHAEDCDCGGTEPVPDW